LIDREEESTLNHAFQRIEPSQIYAKFKAMRIKHPMHEAAVECFQKLRNRKIAAPTDEQTAGSLFAGSQSGKTKTVEWYIEQVVVEDWLDAELLKAANDNERNEVEFLRSNGNRKELAKLQTFAFYVELSGATNISGLISDFLIALGDPNPFRGTPKERRFRAEKILAQRGYQIIFLDETQHIKTQTHAGSISRQEDATEVQNTIKRWVKRWPIVFVGTQQAEEVVFEHQVYTRSEPPIKFGPLHYTVEEDKDIFLKFCGRLSIKIAQSGILPKRPEILVTGDVPLCLNIATKGRLGMVTIVVRAAIECAYAEGKLELERKHLEKGVSDQCLRIGLCSYNPFTNGPIIIPSKEEYALDKAA